MALSMVQARQASNKPDCGAPIGIHLKGASALQ